jgi:hypothetical protein
MVQFTKDMRPQRAGERRVLPDAAAHRLVADGAAVIVASVFDRVASETPAAPEPKRPRRYSTR